MRSKFPIFVPLSRMTSLLSQVCWRDPLVQTWGLIGGLLIVGIVTHYAPGSAGGENKNLSPAAALFYTKKPLVADNWRPGIPFSPVGSAAGTTALPSEPDLRACADRAAHRPGWLYLAAPLRTKLGAVSGGIARITVTWSGTHGGDAGALDLYYSGTHGQSGGLTEDFIIGNGRRGTDGRIEATRHWTKTLAEAGTAPESAEISICLVGDGQKPTPSQEEALGELITCIEARTGTTTLAMRQPQSGGLLAGY
jgi:hypothetical protein